MADALNYTWLAFLKLGTGSGLASGLAGLAPTVQA